MKSGPARRKRFRVIPKSIDLTCESNGASEFCETVHRLIDGNEVI